MLAEVQPDVGVTALVWLIKAPIPIKEAQENA
jgi:hypothetical protein